MASVEPSDLGDDQVRAWRATIADAVDLLLSQAERRLAEETKGAFGTRNPRALLLLQIEQARVGELRERLRTVR
jgi:hypothetical protein